MDISFDNFVLFWICIIGLCLGSFYNVVILRSLSNESIVFPPSKCPKCNHKLFWWHNIPIFSYLILKGKCYFCGEKISPQYPIIEFVTMILFALTFLKFGFSLFTLFVIIWISCLIIMTMTDLKEKVVDCNIAIIMALSGILYNFTPFCNWYGLKMSFLGLILGILIIESIALLGYLFVGKRAMGEADTYVAGALGAILGWESLLLTLGYSLVAAMVIIVPMFLYNQLRNKNIPILITSAIFTISIILFKTIFENWLTYGFVAISGLTLAALILKGLKNKKENNIYLPFVPALSAGTLYFIFFVI